MSDQTTITVRLATVDTSVAGLVISDGKQSVVLRGSDYDLDQLLADIAKVREPATAGPGQGVLF